MEAAEGHALAAILVVQHRDGVFAVRKVLEDGRDLAGVIGWDGGCANDRVAVFRETFGLVVQTDENFAVCAAEAGDDDGNVADIRR